MLIAKSRDVGGNIEEWTVKPSKELKLQERTFKGIPDCWRSAAWEVLMNRFTRTGTQELERLAGVYRTAIELPSTYDVQIDLDVPRTISGHVMFRTRYGQG
jgi:USP6 N-terminal-like protein